VDIGGAPYRVRLAGRLVDGALQFVGEAMAPSGRPLVDAGAVESHTLAQLARVLVPYADATGAQRVVVAAREFMASEPGLSEQPTQPLPVIQADTNAAQPT